MAASRSLRSAVCFDLDSTLASTVHRRFLVPDIKAGRATWHDYSMFCAKDAPVAGTVALARMLYPSRLICIVSGRSTRAEDLTREWLSRNDVPFDRVILRSDDIDNKLFKVNSVRQLQAEGLSVELFVEDWNEVAAYITEQTGIPVLGVNPFDEGSTLVTRDQLAAALDEVAEALDEFAGEPLVIEPSGGACLVSEIFPRLGGAF